MAFDEAVAFTLSHEGGYNNTAGDAGGETNFGISKRAYPSVDIRALTKDGATSIYRRDYWNALGCDSLESALGCVVFDTAVNMGPGRARQFLAITTDWREYQKLRVQFYLKIIEKHPDQVKFKKGWMRRVEDLSVLLERGDR